MFRHSVKAPARPAPPSYVPNAEPAAPPRAAGAAPGEVPAARWAAAHADLPERDYVSPGLEVVRPDAAFPHMTVGNTAAQPWPYLRRQIPHTWYVDDRAPVVGFASRDEASILYNTARRFAGRRALEVGCWMGWSAAHLLLGGVELDVIDPLLGNPAQRASVESSLAAAGVIDRARLVPGLSPQKIHELGGGDPGRPQRRWSLFFIDGNHDAPGPFNDTVVAERYAEADALMLFHDLASPEVSVALDYLQARGWRTMIYQTMQIMGVAWRGNVEPVRHRPDPRVQWPLPGHLSNHPVSG